MVIYEHYSKVLGDFRKKNGDRPVYAFAVLKMDEIVDKWSIIICLDWTVEDRKRIFNSFIETLQQNLNSEEMSEIARVSFYRPNEHLMRLFFEKFTSGQHIREDAKVNGNIVHDS